MDSVTLRGDFRDIYTTLSANVGAGATVLSVASADGFQVGDLAVIHDGARSEAKTITAVDTTSSPNTITIGSGLSYPHNSGLPVYDVENVTYQLNGTELMRNGQLLATNIHDLQFAYQIDADGDGTVEAGWLNAPADPSQIRVVRVGLIALSSRADPTGVTFTTPQLENGKASSTSSHRYRVLRRQVKVRNLGL